jgi:regulator of protease activity HflC (stomatin/prohibitin superfamily)
MKRFPWRAVFLILGALFLLNLVRGLFLVVQAGERAVIFSKISGTRPYQLGEGMHLRLPFVWEATKYDVRSRTYTMSGGGAEGHDPNRAASATQVPDDSLQALTADGLPVTMDLSVRFHVDPDRVWRLHQEIGPDFVDKVIRPQSRSITRMAVAQYPVVDVYSGRRQAIIEQIQRELRPAFQKSHLILDEVLLRDVRFPDPFQAAIERKQVAQQEAQQMTFEVERARSEKQQRIVEAEGEAEGDPHQGRRAGPKPATRFLRVRQAAARRRERGDHG